MNTWRRAPRAVAIWLDEPTLFRFIVLSLLLHVWFVLLFGTTTGGGARRDFAPGDILEVTLRQRIDESGASFRWTPGASDSTQGSALLPRERAAPRPPPQAPRDTKPAPSPPRANEGAAERAQPPAAPEAPVPEPIDAAPRAAPTVVLPVPEPLQRFNPDAPESVDKPYVPTPVPPPAPTAPPPAAVVPAPREVRPAPVPAPQDIAPVVAPTARPAPEAPPAIEREIAPAPPRETQPVRREAPVTERSDVPAEPVPRADVPPAPRTPTIEPPPPLPAPRTAPPTIEREAQPPAEKPAPRAPTIEPAPRSEPIAAPPARETAPAPTTPAIAEPVAPREQRIAPSSTPATPSAPVAPTAPMAPPARSESSPAAPPPRLRFGEPAPDEDMFKPRRDAVPAAEPGSAPKLDLDEAKRRAARDIVREGSGSRGLLSVIPPPPERESKEARALAKAAKPDCRSAYADMGLLAAVPLVASAIGNSGCRW